MCRQKEIVFQLMLFQKQYVCLYFSSHWISSDDYFSLFQSFTSFFTCLFEWRTWKLKSRKFETAKYNNYLSFVPDTHRVSKYIRKRTKVTHWTSANDWLFLVMSIIHLLSDWPILIHLWVKCFTSNSRYLSCCCVVLCS